MWRMDAEGRFSLGSDEFTRLIGAAHRRRLRPAVERDRRKRSGSIPTAASLKAVATRETWTGITLNWPVDGGGRLPVELAGLADLRSRPAILPAIGVSAFAAISMRLTRLAALRRHEFFSDPPAPQTLSADIVAADPATGRARRRPGR